MQKGVLLPRILASGREWQRRACVALYVGGLPEDANGRLQLVGVTACGTRIGRLRRTKNRARAAAADADHLDPRRAFCG